MAKSQSGGVSSLQRAISILGLFDIEHPTYTADEIITALECSRPQGYRYLRELCRAGFLARSAASYRLGARAIELDYIVRESDPLLRAAIPTMQEVCEQSSCDVLLMSLVGDRIITIHHERGADRTTVSYTRGRLMPRFLGAGSKAILSTLPQAQQRAFYETYGASEPDTLLGKSWEEIRAALKAIRSEGVAVSLRELEPENVGIAAPISNEIPGTYASLVLVLSTPRYRTTDPAAIARLVIAAAERISDRMKVAPLPSITSPRTG